MLIKISDKKNLNDTINFMIRENIPFEIIKEMKNPKEPSFGNIGNNRKFKLGKKGNSVLELLASGHNYKEIAEKLEMTIDGVRYYIKKIYSELGVKNSRAAISIYFLQNGIQNS